MDNVVLSIVFITMNRKLQLADAIQSCIEADLPKDYEIVVVDNGSTDGTEEHITKLFSNVNIRYYKQDTNLGIGGGRNKGVDLAKGQFVYILDDDAVINPKYKDNLFHSSISMFNADPSIGAITTRVYDEKLGRYRESRKGKSYKKENPIVLMVHGNTHFIRKGLSEVEYCPTIKYGFEDLYASIRIDDAGYKVVLNENVETIHKPLVDKWSANSPYRNDTVIKEIAGKLTVKSMLFYDIYKPILLLAAFVRTKKTLGLKSGDFRKVLSLYKEQVRRTKVKKISVNTFFFLIKEYGISAVV